MEDKTLFWYGAMNIIFPTLAHKLRIMDCRKLLHWLVWVNHFIIHHCWSPQEEWHYSWRKAYVRERNHK